MSRVRRDMYRRKLDDLLARANDEAFFIMCWATFAIQSGHAENARDLLSFPPEAVIRDVSSPMAIHPWKLETLLNEVLTTPKLRAVTGRPIRVLNCRMFSAMGAVIKALTALENDGITLKRVEIRREIHRLTQRQFEWQRGFLSYTQLYRAGFVYGGDLTRAFFAQANGFTMDDFSLTCFALRAIYLQRPAITISGGMDQIGVSEAVLRPIVNLISLPHAEAQATARELRSGGGHTGYKKSLFRTYPCVRFDGRVHAPLPDLVTLRGTSGLFYDVIRGPDHVKNEISGRFETYCREFLASILSTLRITGSYKYRYQKNQVDTPDVLLYEEGELSVTFECKATRMSYQARFSEDPMANDRRGYAEMAKGVFQIWQFASRHRRGLLPSERFRPDVRGVVLTLDAWLSMADVMQKDVFALAWDMAVERDPQINDADRVPVTFCQIDDLETTLGWATPASFLAAIRAATKERYQGWMLWSVHREVARDVRADNEYPFAERIAEVLPWWTRFEARSRGARG